MVCWAQLSQLIDMQVGTADSGAFNFYKDVVDTDVGFGDVFQPEALGGVFFYQGFHIWDPSVYSLYLGKTSQLWKTSAFKKIFLPKSTASLNPNI